MRALAVEDDPRIRADLAAALAAAGFRVETCADGEEAWFLGDTEDYGLVVLDPALPVAFASASPISVRFSMPV